MRTRYRLFPFIMLAFVLVLVLSNTVAVKVVRLGPLYLAGATLLFPISYIFGDILTEVYGYRRSRAVIWAGFGANVFMAFVYWGVGALPAAPAWHGQEAYGQILGQAPRIVLASLVAFFCGEFTNSFVLARMKVLTRGRGLPSRFIGSTIVGQLVDTTLFVGIAFAGIVPLGVLVTMVGSNYLFKTVYEIVATPVTVPLVKAIKRVEGEDYFDHGTNFSPFAVSLDDLRA